MVKKYLLSLCIVLFISAGLTAAEKKTTFRTWYYNNISVVLHDYVSWTILPGFRYEPYTSIGEQSNVYFIEFFSGPVITPPAIKTGPGKMMFVIPLWYYYNGYPIESIDEYATVHNIALVPMVINAFKHVMIMNRFFFYNTFYADKYHKLDGLSKGDQWGFSSLLAWKIELMFFPIKNWGINIANELFSGIIENPDVTPSTGIGFSEKGIQFNRIYAGFSYSLAVDKTVIIKFNPHYVCELNYIGEGFYLRAVHHYFYLVTSFTFDLRGCIRKINESGKEPEQSKELD